MGKDKKNGWIKLDRVFFEHSLWEESREFSRAEAWIDLIQLARYSETPDVTQIKDRHITCNRGQLIHSLKTLAKRWGWSRSKVKRVLDVFVSRDMIRYRNETVTSCITICNYDTYQPLKSSSETQIERKRNASETQVDTQEEGKERKKEVFVEKNCEEQLRKQIFQRNKKYYNEADFNRTWGQFCWVCEQNGVAFSETRWNTYTQKK
jgi:hydroxymethylpyrimidine pyrophosphatase-like HAD family hydrolase